MSFCRSVPIILLIISVLFTTSLTGKAYAQTCTDADGDGWGVNGDASCPGTGVDCDDTDATVYPGALKICDGKDNNCDGKTDYATDVDSDQDGVPVCGGDCDDTNPDEYPGNIEGPYLDATCGDFHDNDCDTLIDGSDPDCQVDCTDNDMDGYGTGTECLGPDCNDNDPLINPGIVTDDCDGKDNDCDTLVDEDHTNTPTTCGVGECAGNTGQLECQGGGVVDTCDPLAGAVAEDTPGSGLCIDTLDNDCDGAIDNPLGSCYVDTPDRDDDGDGYCDDPTTCSDGSTPGDCDDVDPTVYPGAPDAICNGIDNNCDGTEDDEYQTTPTTCGVGECAGNTGAIECQGGIEGDTCDEFSGAVPEDTPGTGVCIDGLDNDCDGEIDNPTGSCLDLSDVTDNDGDGWCEVGPCLPPANPGFVGDCDDTDATVYPGALKICDGKDNNCDGKRDYATDVDSDQDGVPVCGGDCDDTNPDEYPGNIEGPYLDPTCGDTHDNDCDTLIDGSDPDCQVDCTDNDMDGYGTGTECLGPDCNDNDPLINPGIVTDDCDGKDNDCDTLVDEDHTNTPTTCGVGECAGNTGQLECQGGGVVDTCDPLSGAVPEDTPGSGVCIDTLDNDCDGEIDNPLGSCYVDTPDRDDDGDGYCDDPTTCSDGSTPGDCDDVDPTVYPGAPDAICNGIDNNCDGTEDNEYQTTPTTCGVGECAGNTGAIECQNGIEGDTCLPLEGSVPEDTPGTGVCIDGLDNDCDGEIDNPTGSCLDLSDVTDDDGDGWCEVGPCLPPANPGFVGDCDDTDATVYPGALKICDGKDNNCDGKKDYATDVDSDQDGVAVCGGDCDDTNPDEYPGNIEGPYLDATCGDTHDNDCDTLIDGSDPDCQIDCTDNDMDGYGTGTECLGPDCNDNDPLINSGIVTDDCDGKDNDCDTLVDEDHTNTPTTCGVGECAGNTGQLECQGGGVVDTCDPLSGAVPEDTPGTGVCIDGLDNDCDGEIDNPLGSCYVDTPDRDDDGDGYCDDPTTCSDGSTPGDCDDVDPTVYPGAPDAICNGIDNNCDGTEDDEYQTTPTTCGVGECAGNTGAIECQGGIEGDTCDEFAGAVPEDTPGTGVCIDGLDNDCDGEIDNPTGSCLDLSDVTDDDGDGWCEVGPCLPPANPGFVGDCDDTDATVYPGAQKICDGKDNNCDGKRDFATDIDFDQDGVPVCAGDCDDNDPLAYPGNTPEGRFGDPTCSDIRDNDCVDGTDAVDPKCDPPSCGTDTTPRTGPHSEDMRDPGPDGIPNTGDDIDHPENSDLLCGKCHNNNNFQDPIRDDCFRCHTAGGQSKLDYPDPWPFGFGSAPDVMDHSSTVVGTKYGAWDMDCNTCHNPHVQEQDVVYGTTYGKLIKEYICFDNTVTGLNIEEIVVFTSPSGLGSFADGPPHNSNICEMCHTQTDYHRRDGSTVAHNDGDNCTSCHSHLKGFKFGATGQSHTTHLSSIKGPQLNCISGNLGCHGTNQPPFFADGNDLSATAVCDNCHSPGGVFDGVDDPAIGAKPNWESGIYNDRVLQTGKEMWCSTCHDDSPANSKMNGYGVSAANVVGDDSTFGFYVTGHGQNIQIDCITCHDANAQHIDHESIHLLDNSEKDKVFNLTDYRFYQGKRLEIKHHNSVPDKFRLCFTCHEETWVTDTVTLAPDLETNFRKDNYTLIHGMFNNGNLHAYHTAITSCSTCHNVHGLTLDASESLVPTFTRMMREWAGSYVNLTYDTVTDKYYELTDPAKWNDPVYNQGGASTSPLYCGSCHGYTDLTNGVGPNETYVIFGAPWYLRTYKPHTYSVVFDMDSDGLTDNIDNCPAVANIDQADADIDYVGDACDTCPNDPVNDADVDGLCGDVDICPYDQLDDYDGDGICGDIDNCDAHSNLLQADSDEDGFGDICDNCVNIPNPDQANYDGDMLGDVCDDTCSAYVQISMNMISLPSILSGAGTVYDSVGNIYFAGTTDADLAGQIGLADMVLIKYDVSGSPLWTRQFGTAGADYTFDIVIDPSDNLLILGRDDASNIFVAKYDTAGNQEWTVQTPGVVRDIAVDDSGNVYVSTHRQHDYGVIKYDTDGNELWRQHVNATFRDYALTLAVDDAENVYLGGVSQVGYYDFFIIKFDTNGIHQWTTTLDPGDEWTYVHDIVADTEGNTYVTGTAMGNFANISTDYEQHYTLKLDPSGNHIWTRQVAQSVIGGAEKISIDNTGNIYVTDYGLDLISYDPDGNQRFASHFTVPDHSATFGLIYDSAGLPYLTGMRDNATTGSQELFIMNVGGNCQ